MTHFKAFRLAVCAAFCLLGLGVSAFANAQLYSITELGTLGGTTSTALDINNLGQVVGDSFTAANPHNGQHATLWYGNTITDLGTWGGNYSTASAINNRGQVVGWGASSDNSRNVGTLWDGDVMTDLGGITLEYPSSRAEGINDAGWVVGRAREPSGNVDHAFVWDGSTMTELGTTGGSWGGALAINNANQIVGYDSNSTEFWAMLWDGTTATNLGNLGGSSIAYDINNGGQVVGSSYNDDFSQRHAALWDGGTIVDLGTLGGSFSECMGINNRGQIVGYSSTIGDTGNSRATLWNGSTIFDLNTLLDSSGAGWTLFQARAINDHGQIVGTGINGLGQQRGFMLNPIPEPETYAMLLAGLGLMAFWGRRRRQNETAAA